MKTGASVAAATTAAVAMIAHQVGGKATRDAFFLSNFDVTSLPTMVIAAAVVSIVAVLFITGAMTRLGPSRVVLTGFVASAALHGLEWFLSGTAPRAVAVIIYLHTAVFGLVLISGFWSLVTERFDPRTAKLHMGRIAGGATLGGLLGGILTERVGATLGLSTMLPILGVLHLLCAAAVIRFLSSSRLGVPPSPVTREAGVRYGFRVLREVPYLRHLALVVLLGTVSAALVDYVFKSAAAGAFTDGERLVRFFAAFYTGVSLITFLVQNTLSGVFLERLGLTRTVSSLPLALGLGSLGAVFFPGLAGAAAVRGGESVLRSSLFRSGYELHYTPVPRDKKRSTKTIVDVGFDRLGDGLGGGLVQLVLFLAPVAAVRPSLLVLAAAVCVGTLIVVRLLQRGYVKALEESLVNRAVDLDLEDVSDSTTRQSLLRTMSSFTLDRETVQKVRKATRASSAEAPPAPVPADPVLRRLADLRSGDAERVRGALAGEDPLEAVLVPQAVRLLAWDDVCETAVRALVRTGPRIVGQLIDALIDPETEFAIRRRIPRVMAEYPVARSGEGLFQGLEDRRFEVRFQCGRALARLQSLGAPLAVTPEAVYKAVLYEVNVDPQVWTTRQLLERTDDEKESLFVNRDLGTRANRSLEHVFTVLALVLPREPLKIAFRGLHTRDPVLRGTALEYLESVLPAAVREKLWPLLLKAEAPKPPSGRSREEILDNLLKSNQSIEIELKDHEGDP